MPKNGTQTSTGKGGAGYESIPWVYRRERTLEQRVALLPACGWRDIFRARRGGVSLRVRAGIRCPIISGLQSTRLPLLFALPPWYALCDHSKRARMSLRPPPSPSWVWLHFPGLTRKPGSLTVNGWTGFQVDRPRLNTARACPRPTAARASVT